MKFHKKGVALAQVVEAILALIVLGVIITIVFGDILIESLSGISDYIKKIKVPEREFTPYEESDKVVIDSLNGLRCALNSVASGKLGTGDSNLCPEHDEVLANAALRPETFAITQSPNPMEPPEEEPETAETTLSAINNTEIKDAKQLENMITGAIVAARAAEAPEEEKVEEEKEEPCLGLKFGEICVECFDVFTLSKDRETAIQQFVAETLSCWRAFQTNEYENIYCGKIAISADFIGEVTERAFCKALDNSGSLGGDLAGSGICGGFLIGENYEWKIGTLKAGSAPFYICGDNLGDNELFITRDPKDCEISRMYSVKDIRDNACVIHNFELPQKFNNSGLLHPMNWIAGYNDPDYVVYYQAFPEGADRFWHVDKLSAATIGVTVAFAIFDAIPAFKAGASLIRKAVSETMQEGAEQAAKKMAKQGIRTAVVGFFKSIKKIGWKRTLRKTFLEETFQTTHRGVSKSIAGDISQQADDFFRSRIPFLAKFRRLRALIQPGYKKQMREALEQKFLKTLNKKGLGLSDDLFLKYLDDMPKMTLERKRFIIGSSLEKEFRDEALNAYRKKVAREMAEKAVHTHTRFLTKAATRELMRGIKAQNFFKGFFKKGAKGLNEKAIKEGLENSLRKMGALPWWRRKFLLDQSTELAERFIDKRGVFSLVKATGGVTIDATAATARVLPKIPGAVVVAPGLIKTTAGEIVSASSVLARELTDDFLKFGQKALSPSEYRRLLNLVVGSTGKGIWKGGKFITAKTGKALWNQKAKWATAMALFAYFNGQDAAGEKLQPVGANSLAVARPGVISSPVSFDLNNISSRFFITPKIHKHSRFYLASPCKADLIIREDLCTCSRIPIGYQHLPVAEGQHPLDAKGLELNDNTLQDEDFVYEHFKKTRPEKFKTFTEFGSGKGQFKSEEEFVKYVKKLLNRNKFWQDHEETYINISKINDSRSAIIAKERMDVANFFDNVIKGAYVTVAERGSIYTAIFGDVFSVGEEVVPLTKAWPLIFNEYKPYFDFRGVQTLCNSRGFTSHFIDTQVSSWKILLGLAAEDWEGMKQDLASDPWAHPNYKIPCLTVAISRHEGWNDNINYCIDEFTYIGAKRAVWFAATMAASLVVSIFGDGPGLSMALAIGGLYAGYAEEQAARQAKWPAVEEQGLKGKVPIVQSTWTEADWALWGGVEKSE